MSTPAYREKEKRDKREWTRLARLWQWARTIETELFGPQANLRSALGSELAMSNRKAVLCLKKNGPA